MALKTDEWPTTGPSIDFEQILPKQIHKEYISCDISSKQIISTGPCWDELLILQQKSSFFSPIVDITSKCQRIRALSSFEISFSNETSSFDIAKSFSIHSLLITLFFISKIFLNINKQQETTIVDIAFGLTQQSMQELPTKALSSLEGETQATKKPEILPSLPKNISVKTPENQENLDHTPAHNDTNDMPLHTKIKSKIPEKKEIKALSKNHPLTEKEILQRILEDKKKIALKNKHGLIESSTNKGSQKNLNKDLPPIPDALRLSTKPLTEALPNLPQGLSNGQVSSHPENNAYLIALTNQLRLHWQVSEQSHLDAKWKTKIQFKISALGTLLGEPQIISSSGHKDFDALVLEACRSTFPIGAPPATLTPPLVFTATYDSQGVQ